MTGSNEWAGSPDADTVARLCDHLGKGLPRAVACHLAGLEHHALEEWISDVQERGDASPHAKFVRAARAAEAKHVAGLLEVIHRAAETDWEAAAWLLRHGQSLRPRALRNVQQNVPHLQLVQPAGGPE